MRLHVTRAARLRAERRLRRAVRAAGIAVAAVGLVGASALAALPASATTTMPMRAVGGDRQITAAWNRVPGAAGYTVHWGPGTSTAHSTHATGTWIRLNGVTNGTTYSLRVTPDGVAGTSTMRVTARPVPYIPTSITSVRAVPAGPDRIRVSWKGGTQARSFSVIWGSDSMLTRNRGWTSWYPAALQSWTITIPKAKHDVLGGGSGNAVFVKVALTNSTTSNPSRGLVFNGPARFRLTPSGTWSFAGMPTDTAPSTPLSVASWNVQSLTASSTFTAKDQWAARKSRVVANIESLHPDLIGLQELTTARIVPDCLNPSGSYPCVEQYQTLQTALGTKSAAVSTVYRNAREDANAWMYQQASKYGNLGRYVDSALFYNPAKLSVLRSGFLSLRAIPGLHWPSSLTDEAGMWARFQIVGTSTTFYAASIHMPSASGATMDGWRKAEALSLAKYMDSLAGGTPIVFVGDFNANGAMEPNAGSLQLRSDGYIDAGATSNRGGYWYSSSNGSNGTDGPDSGYPIHAVKHAHPTSRIDYIMLKNSPFTYGYWNEVRLVPGTTRFDPRYQGSDHNLQLAHIGIADPS
ncbi:MAG TPA: endonuclease/exonuclease/phosphatase family protein [Amnibacterium sp.]|uniref:endonuclease/exonuclease/phosphatase family protein n=1 Tax=Amnibacterium sp. TaxID=1872496 RepID=UPI002F91F2A0